MELTTDHACFTFRKRVAAQASACASRGSMPQRPPRAIGYPSDAVDGRGNSMTLDFKVIVHHTRTSHSRLTFGQSENIHRDPPSKLLEGAPSNPGI